MYSYNRFTAGHLSLYSSSDFAIRHIQGQPSAYNCSRRLTLSFEGTARGEISSVTLCNGRGVAGRVAEGATQPEDVTGPGRAAS